MADRPGRVPLAARIVALAVAGIILSALGAFLITFRGPPPRPAPTDIADIAALIREGRAPPASGRQLSRKATRGAPSPRLGERAAPEREAQLANLLHVEPAGVRFYYEASGPGSEGGESAQLRGDFTVGVEQGNRWTIVRSVPEPWLTGWYRVTLLSMLGAIFGLGLVAWAIARAIVRPLAQLADAAHTIEIGRRPAPVDVNGPPEVRQVAQALNTMQDRLADQIATRTTMLAAIAHDLGTPLSRLAFHLDKLPDFERERAEAEMIEMRAMIGSVIDFAWHDPTRMGFAEVELVGLLHGVAGERAALANGAPVFVRGDAPALRRLFGNLIENAHRYAGRPGLRCAAEGSDAVVRVSDTGPGIDPALLPRIFEPFVRGEPSRNRDTGGTGLGLAIVRSIAEAHGGSVELQNLASSGLEATVRLPLLK